jgi:hypothetical protein
VKSMKTYEFKNHIRRAGIANKIEMSETMICNYAKLYRKYAVDGDEQKMQAVRKAAEASTPYHVFRDHKETKKFEHRMHLEKMRAERSKRSPGVIGSGGKKSGKKGKKKGKKGGSKND